MKYFLIILFFCCQFIYSQNSLKSILMNVDQENISEYEFRELEELYNDKIDINISSLNDLKKLFFISETTLNRIISEREKIGNFKNLNQLYEVPDLNINELKYLIPFLKINTKQNKSIKLHPELKTRFRHKTATETNYYKVIGNNEFYVFNFLKSTDYSDKQIFHYTLNIKLNSFLREIVLGRYYIKFGFGLNFWGPYKIFKSSDLNNIRLSNKHFKPYTLSSETNMMEGFAFEVRHKSFFLKPFYSNSDRDIFSNRLIKSNTTRGFIFGTNNRLANVNFILSESQNQYAEKTEEKLNLGASINFKYKSHSIQSEMVFSQKCLSKIILYKLKLNQRVKISFLHRNFNNLNKNSYSNPVRESSSLKNETANSFGINIKLKKLKINFTSEFYSVSSDKVVNNFISGKEIKIDLSSNLTTELNARLKLNYEKKEEPVLTDVFKQTSHLINYKSSLSFNYRLQPNF